jgi:hypothetical protein
MNRHARRRQAALNRSRRTGYLHRIVQALGQDGNRPAVGIHFAAIEHDPACGIYRCARCDCVPAISVSGPEGVTVIDERGVGIRRARS